MNYESIDKFEQEEDEGKVEYKLKLYPKPDSIRLEKLASQMNFRLTEGNGEAIYELGIADSGDTSVCFTFIRAGIAKIIRTKSVFPYIII